MQGTLPVPSSSGRSERARELEPRNRVAMLTAMGRSAVVVLGAALVVAGCSRTQRLALPRAEAQAPGVPSVVVDAGVAQPRPTCADAVPVFDAGRETGRVCPADAAAQGLTVVDLANDWAPWVFDGHEGMPAVRYRDVYRRLADERGNDAGSRASDDDLHLELYGIFPTFRVLRERASSSEVHSCDDAIDDAPLETFHGTIDRAERRSLPASPQLDRLVEAQRRQLEREAARRHLASIDELAGDARFGAIHTRYRELLAHFEVNHAIQAHLRCEGLLGRAREGVFDTPTVRALTAFQRRHMRVSRGTFDEPTRDFMVLTSRERVYQGVLRALRERVVDATGLIEDGTAAAAFGTVFGRDLNAPELEATAVLGALPNGAPDLISPATEAAARALGWVDPPATEAWLAAHPDLRAQRVAVRLPPLPAYHASHMDLRAEIDRGDVRRGRSQPGDRRPNTTVFVRHAGGEIALVRWSTTIGGYQDELLEDGTVGTRYKESPAGARIWRDVVAAPSWMPPPTTPDDELIGRGRVNRSIVGPGYRSAYGLLMVMHHRPMGPGRDGQPRFLDEGVRSHGSVSYHSILSGFSHGCHRLFNHLALRLGGFLVRHRNHVVRGNQEVEYVRTLIVDGEEQVLRIDTRGYLYELTPPVDIEVLEGTVHFRR